MKYIDRYQDLQDPMQNIWNAGTQHIYLGRVLLHQPYIQLNVFNQNIPLKKSKYNKI